jgi:hypothetical protein
MRMKLINRKKEESLAWLWEEVQQNVKATPDFHPEAYSRGVEDALVYLSEQVQKGRVSIRAKRS